MAEQKPKKSFLGCSTPVLIGVVALLLGLFAIGFASGPLGRNIVGEVGLPAWLSLDHAPHVELPAEVIFHIFGFPISNSIITTWITMLLLVIFSFAVTRSLKVVPGRWQALLEFIIESLLNFCKSVAGDQVGRRVFPVIATIFLFVAFNAWLGLLPGFGSLTILTHEGKAHLLRPANTDLNTPLSIALASFIFVEYFGLKMLGLSYIKKFLNFGQFFDGLKGLVTGKVGAGLSGIFLGVINIFVGVIELVSELARVISFTLRLFGNMTAGEILLVMVAFLVPFLAALPFYGLELLVGFVQALIFSGLTLIFITVAITSHDESH
jgi:F-type H+-transporting ATPase subunit a